jgi:hypothetical protein
MKTKTSNMPTGTSKLVRYANLLEAVDLLKDWVKATRSGDPCHYSPFLDTESFLKRFEPAPEPSSDAERLDELKDWVRGLADLNHDDWHVQVAFETQCRVGMWHIIVTEIVDNHILTEGFGATLEKAITDLKDSMLITLRELEYVTYVTSPLS